MYGLGAVWIATGQMAKWIIDISTSNAIDSFYGKCLSNQLCICSLGFALIVNFMTNRTLNQIDMVEALKSME